MSRSLWIGAIALVSLAAGIAVLSSETPQIDEFANSNLEKLANGNREYLLAVTGDNVTKCLKTLNLAQDAPHDVALAVNKHITKTISEAIYLSLNKKMTDKEAVTEYLKHLEKDINILKEKFDETQLRSIEKFLSSVSDHPDMTKCVISRLRAHSSPQS